MNRYKKIIALLLTTILFWIGMMIIHPNPVFYDEATYIRLAENIMQGRGFVSDAVHYYFTPYDRITHPEDVWMPLYPTLISIISNTGISPFLSSRIINLLCTLSIIYLTYLLGKELFNEKVGISTSVLMAFNVITIMSFLSMSESLFLGLELLCFYFLFRHDSKDLIKSGFFAGMAYLTRSMGILLLPIVFVYTVMNRRNFLYFLLYFLIPFLIVTSPYLYRNYLIFGDPIYNVHNFMFWSTKDTGVYYNQYNQELPSMIDYITKTSPLITIQRFINGLSSVAITTLIVIFYPIYPLFRFLPIFNSLGIPILVLFIIGTWIHIKKLIKKINLEYRNRFILIIYLYIIISLIVFAWDPIGAQPRYQYPLLPFYLYFILNAFFGFRNRISNKLVTLAVILILLSLSYPFIFSYVKEKEFSYSINTGRWIYENTGKDDIVMVGGAGGNAIEYYSKRKVMHIPKATPDELNFLIKKYNPRLFVITTPPIGYPPDGGELLALSKYWNVTRTNIKEIKKPPMKRIYEEKEGDEVRVIVYNLLDSF